jgi:hypothetical protein
MLTRDEIENKAQFFFSFILDQKNSMLKNWKKAILGEAFLVRDIELEPVFWIVPVELGERVLGHINLGLDGCLMGHVYFNVSPDDLECLPEVVTRLSAKEALKQAKDFVGTRDVKLGEPVYVYDKFRGWLAWLVSVSRSEKELSRIYVTPNYVYERKPEEDKKPSGLRGA